MNQRVNIQYSIDVDDLDFELERLLARTKDCLNQTNSELQKMVNQTKGSQILRSDTVERISEIRENLARVDFTLSDVSRLVGAYVSYQLEQEQPEAPQEEVEDSMAQPPPSPRPPPSSDIYPSNFQAHSHESMEAAANKLQETIKNGSIPIPADLDPEMLAEKLEEFKKSMKNV